MSLSQSSSPEAWMPRLDHQLCPGRDSPRVFTKHSFAFPPLASASVLMCCLFTKFQAR